MLAIQAIISNKSTHGFVLDRDQWAEFRMAGETTMRLNLSLRKTDAIAKEIRRIVRSADGRSAAIEATQRALPALSGVDRLLREKLGDRYKNTDRGTNTAGAFVAEVMREFGYNAGTRRRCGGDSLAQSGIFWTCSKAANQTNFAEGSSRIGHQSEARQPPGPREPEYRV